jgi:hypothetical protein
MEDHPTTCGQGLAANAALPEVIGDLLGAMADVLEDHRQALDLKDPDARPERDAYATLVEELRALSSHAGSVARRMKAYRDLPMGAHDEARMSAPEALAIFDRFVTAERHLLQVLSSNVAAHEQMRRRQE